MGEAISAAEIEAVRPFGDVNVVVRAAVFPVFHCTVEQGSMPEPITESVKAGPPAAALEGESEVMVGVGSEVGTLNVKLAAAEVEAELETVMLTDPGKAISA